MTTFRIDRLGHLGDGIAAGPVFAARTLPGEVVAGDIAVGRIVTPRVLTPSPDRIAPPCPHYRACGGCALMHASDAFVADWKVGVVRAALAAHGLETPDVALHTSPPGSRRRATLAGRRTKRGALVGFHGRASDVLTEVTGCLVLSPAIVAGLPALAALTVAGASRGGVLSLAVTAGPDGLDVAVTGGKPADAALSTDLAAVAGAHGLARLSWDGVPVVESRAPAQAIGRARVVPPNGAFLQATAEGQAALTGAVRAAVGNAARIADLFAGCGTFALPLAEQAAVHAVEGAPDMLVALDRGWRGVSGLRAVTTEVRDIFRRPLTAAEISCFDAVVIDPPRAGAAAQVADIAASNVPRVASVSCNPVTFARDAAVLVAAGFVIDRIDVVDQFRWSPHVEVAAALVRH